MSTLKRFFPAILLATLVIATAPAIGEIRNLLFASFPRSVVPLLAGSFALVFLALLVFAVVRIREHRGLRYAGLLGVVALLWLQTFGFSREMIQVEVVEKVHIFEYGLMAYLLYRAFRPLADLRVLLLPLLWVGFAGTLEEGVQWWVQSRVGEIRDVALNGFAGICGLLFSLSLEPPERFVWRLGDDGTRQVTRTAALVVAALGLFFAAAHLGHLIEDPEIGRFRSRYTADELRRLAERRAETWAEDPPTGLAIWQHEDYFLSEAGFHASHRNGAWVAGDFTSAWHANRILEKYYEPFLDLRSFRTGTPHRYPAAQRQTLEERAGRHDPSTWTSPVLAGRIYPRPSKVLFLTVLAGVVALLWAWPWLRGRGRARDP